MRYRAEIDGLRAIAVLPVILFHAGFDVFGGGYVGVDVFFVISGYLITSILLSEFSQGDFSFARFYERRARRILPALFVVILACFPFAYVWMSPAQLDAFGLSVASVSIFASNILFWREAGYFDAASEIKPLLHTWSLAVEEQFYLLFPIFLALIWRYGRRWALAAVVCATIVSFAWAQWGTSSDEAKFFLAPARIWELFAGSIAAFYKPKLGSGLIAKTGQSPRERMRIGTGLRIGHSG
jgi:peptidoglycan/LPS O-acetylase OafA/YrhL